MIRVQIVTPIRKINDNGSCRLSGGGNGLLHGLHRI